MDANLAGRRRMWAGASEKRARDDFADRGLRADIHLSWQRSQQARAPMDKVAVPFAELDDDDYRLMWAIEPVLARFTEHLRDTRFSLVLADRDGRVVHTFAGADSVRRHLASLCIDSGYVLSEDYAGTNGIGTVLEEGRPLVVVGDEHYSEPFRDLTCAGTPLRNPITRRLEGVLDLACPSAEWSDLISPALAQLRHDVEQELAAKASLVERLIFERFTARCRETSAALAAISHQYMITNAAAADLLAPADQGVIWTALTQNDSHEPRAITLSNGTTIHATSQAISIGGSVGGHLIELALEPDTMSRRTRQRPVRTTFETVVGQIVQADPRRLLILGERGTGKVTAAHRIHESLNADQPIAVLSCELSRVGDGQGWLADLAAHLHRTEETVVLRHLDLLSEAVAQAVVALLDPSVTGRSSARTGGSRQVPEASPRVYATASQAFTEAWDGNLCETFGGQTLTIPPLRDRRPTLPALAATVLKAIDPSLHISGRAVAALQNYDWPGNFAQMKLVLTHAASVSGGHVIGLEHLPRDIAGALRGPQALSRIEELEREAIIAALREQHGNKVRAAESLGMSRSTFYRRLRQLGLDTSALLA